MTTGTVTQRGLERQELLRGLLAEVLEEEGVRNDSTFLFKLERAMSEYLQQRTCNSPRHEFAEETSFVTSRILPRISKFSRSLEEDDALVAELLERIVHSATSRFRSKLQKFEGSA